LVNQWEKQLEIQYRYRRAVKWAEKKAIGHLIDELTALNEKNILQSEKQRLQERILAVVVVAVQSIVVDLNSIGIVNIYGFDAHQEETFVVQFPLVVVLLVFERRKKTRRKELSWK
jgi:hypothetical protein